MQAYVQRLFLWLPGLSTGFHTIIAFHSAAPPHVQDFQAPSLVVPVADHTIQEIGPAARLLHTLHPRGPRTRQRQVHEVLQNTDLCKKQVGGED